jgi:Spy/CpxP family protein refolding chaperone
MRTLAMMAGAMMAGLAWGGEGGAIVPPDARPGEAGAPKISSARMFLYNLGNDRQMLYGDVPMVYQIVGLTDPQSREVEKICQQAKEENSALQKESKPAAKEGYREYYQRLQQRQNEILARYQARINEILTAGQKKVMGQFQALAAERREREQEINAEMQSLILKNNEKTEAKLNQILTEQQKKKLDELFAARKATMRTIAGGGKATE